MTTNKKQVSVEEIQKFIQKYPSTWIEDNVFNESYEIIDSHYEYVGRDWYWEYPTYNEKYKEYNKFSEYAIFIIWRGYRSKFMPFSKNEEVYFIHLFWLCGRVFTTIPAKYISVDELYTIYDFIVNEFLTVLDKNEENLMKIKEMPWFIRAERSFDISYPKIIEDTNGLFSKSQFKEFFNIYKEIKIYDNTRYIFEENKKAEVVLYPSDLLK